MYLSDLPSPGNLRLSQKLRVMAYQCLSALSIRKNNGGSDSEGLGLFFKVCAEQAGAIPANGDVVINGRTLTVANSANTVTETAATAVVANGSISRVSLPATDAIVKNGDATLPIQNSAGTSFGNATATVAAGVLSYVRLPTTRAIVQSGTKINAGTVSGTGNYATITVTNGVITAIVLSAS